MFIVFCYFQMTALFVCEAQMQSQHLLCNIGYQLASKAKRSKNSRYDVSVSSMAYGYGY